MYGAAVWGFYCGVNKTTDENGLRAGGRGRADSFWRAHATYLMTARHGRRPAADTRRRGSSAPAPRVRRPAGRSGLPAPCSLQCNIDAMRLVRASPARSCLARAARQAWQARGEASRPGSVDLRRTPTPHGRNATVTSSSSSIYRPASCTEPEACMQMTSYAVCRPGHRLLPRLAGRPTPRTRTRGPASGTP